jgi:hypothetical protein
MIIATLALRMGTKDAMTIFGMIWEMLAGGGTCIVLLSAVAWALL